MYIDITLAKLVEVEGKKGLYTPESILDALYTTSFMLDYKKTPKRFYVKYKGNEIYFTVTASRSKTLIYELLDYIDTKIGILIKNTDKILNSPLFLRDYPEEAA